MINKIHTFESEKNFQEGVLASLHSAIIDKQKSGEIFRLALSGGSTPGPIYSELAKMDDVDWSKLEIYLVDERYVPLNHPDSNTRLIQETLINKLSQKPAKWITFDCFLSIDQSLQSYQNHLKKEEENFFDIVLLGLGTDGHTASLFPDDELLEENENWVGHSANGNPVPDRLTLTYPALESSREIYFLIKGHQKEEILKEVSNSKPNNHQLPAARLFHLEQTQIFFGKY